MLNGLESLYKKYFHLVCLGGILILATILRLNHLSLRPFWLDEASIVNPLATPLANSWQILIDSGNNATYFYLLKGWSLFSGDSEAGLRSLSVILSLLAIIAIYKFGTRLGGKIVGLWAAFLLATSYFSVFYAIQARHYSLVILLSILSYYQFYLLLEDSKFKRLTWYIVFTVLGVYTHPWFLLLLVSQFVYLLFNKKVVKIFISQVLIILLSLPWIITLWQYRVNGANSWIALTSLKTIFNTFYYFVYGSTGIYIFFGIIAALFIIGHFELTKEMINYKLNHIKYRKINPSLVLLLNYLFFSLLAALFFGYFIPFYEVGRYEAVVLPAFILLFALLFSRIKYTWIIWPLIILLIAFSYTEVINERDSIVNQTINERSTVLSLLSLAQDDDRIVFTGLSRPSIDYYINHLNLQKKILKTTSFPEEMAKHPAYQDVNKIIKDNNNILPSPNPLIKEIKSSSHGRVWLVFTENNPFALSLRKEFQSQFTEQGYLPGPSYYLILYKF